jgi:hypothetical protein
MLEIDCKSALKCVLESKKTLEMSGSDSKSGSADEQGVNARNPPSAFRRVIMRDDQTLCCSSLLFPNNLAH